MKNVKLPPIGVDLNTVMMLILNADDFADSMAGHCRIDKNWGKKCFTLLTELSKGS